MDWNPPFELASLERSWIVGTEGSVFSGGVQNYLNALRGNSEGTVLLCESDSHRFAQIFMAAVYLGRPVVLGNPEWGVIEWRSVLTLIEPTDIFGGDAVVKQVAEVAASTESTERQRNSLPKGSIWIATGGSTGGVKFAQHDWGTLVASVSGWQSLFGSNVKRLSCLLPLYHVSGLMQLIRSFELRMEIVFPNRELEAELISSLDAGTVVSLVTTQLERFLKLDAVRCALQAVEGILMGGGAMSEDLANRARAAKLPIFLSYGMTETAAVVTALPKAEFLEGALNAGRVLGAAKVSVVNAEGKDCSVGSLGRVHVQTPALFKGYLGGTQTSDLVDGFLTDDLGYIDASGCLHLEGRLDRLIITGGEKVDPLEVEAVLKSIPEVKDALVLGLPEVEWGERVVAFYVSTKELSLAPQLKRSLVDYKLPKVICRVEALPLNEQGKPNWKAVRSLLDS